MAGDVGSVGTPPAQIPPLKILTPTVALTTGGSVLKVTVKVNTTGTVNLPLQGTLQAPFKVSLMITAASEGYRSVLKNVSLVCPS